MARINKSALLEYKDNENCRYEKKQEIVVLMRDAFE